MVEGAPGDVVREGSRVIGTGRVVSVPDGPVRLCADAPTTGVGYVPGSEPPPELCEHGVDVTGADLTALDGRREEDGAVEGRATLVGTWQDGVFDVQEQRPPEPAEVPVGARMIGSFNYWPTGSPCPLPAGGLPPTDPMDNLSHASPAMQTFFQAHPASQPFSALRRPEPDQVVFALAVQDQPERQDAERLLRPVLGDRLCIVDALVTPEQLEAATADPALAVGPGADRPFASGTGISDDGTLTPVRQLDVVMVTEELARAAAAHPAGLVEFRSLLTIID